MDNINTIPLNPDGELSHTLSSSDPKPLDTGKDYKELKAKSKELEKLLENIIFVTRLALCGICLGIVGILVSVAGIIISNYFPLHEKNQNAQQFEYNYHHYQPY